MQDSLHRRHNSNIQRQGQIAIFFLSALNLLGEEKRMKIQRSPLRNKQGCKRNHSQPDIGSHSHVSRSRSILVQHRRILLFHQSFSTRNKPEREASSRKIRNNSCLVKYVKSVKPDRVELWTNRPYHKCGLHQLGISCRLFGWQDDNHRKRGTSSGKLHFTHHNPVRIYIRNSRCQHKRKQECDQLESLANIIGEPGP